MLHRLKLKIRRFIKKKFSFVEKPRDQINIQKTLKSVVKVVSTEGTLSAVQMAIINKEKGAYLRFGDGDIYLLRGRDDSLQKSSEQISNEMREAFELGGNSIFKSLPINSHQFGYEEGMFEGNHLIDNRVAAVFLIQTYPFFVGHNIYNAVALSFMATTMPKRANEFLQILKSKCGVLIANENTSEKTRKLLFGNVPFIKTPSSNSYYEIDRIDIEAQKVIAQFNEFRVVVVAMGCSGRILSKRLIKMNYNVFYFDFGSLLDGFDGNNSREWLNLSKIDYAGLVEDL